MNKRWIIWVIIGGVIIAVILIFHAKSTKETVPMNEIFPEQETSENIEYEFVDQTPSVSQKQKPAVKTAANVVPGSSAPAPKTPAVVNKPAVTSPVKPAKTAPSSYTIQAASYKDKDKADKVTNHLKEKGLAAFTSSREVKDTTWYRVSVGDFKTKTEAQPVLAEVQKEYKDSFIIAK